MVQGQGKQEAILQAALALLAERGFHGTPMSLVAQRAGVSPGTIYHYFTSKEELIRVLFQQVKADFSQTVLAGMTLSSPAATQLKQIWLRAFAYYCAHPQEAAFLEQYETSPYLQEDPVKPEATAVVWYQLIHNYQANGLIKTMPIPVLYELTLGVAIRLARQHNAGHLTLDKKTLAQVADICWQSVKA